MSRPRRWQQLADSELRDAVLLWMSPFGPDERTWNDRCHRTSTCAGHTRNNAAGSERPLDPVAIVRWFDGRSAPAGLPLGRLGRGELKFETSEGPKSYFIDGGFIQIKGSVVTLLTNRAIGSADIDATAAQRALEAAQSMPATTDEQYTAKTAADERYSPSHGRG